MWHVWGNIQRLSNTKRSLFGTIQAKAGSGGGGAGGTRTPDPLNAIEVLSQLSYSPTVSMSNIRAGWQSLVRDARLRRFELVDSEIVACRAGALTFTMSPA